MFKDLLTDTIITTATFDTFDLVNFTGGRITTADAIVAGVAKNPNTVIGDPAAIMKAGIVRLRAAGAIGAGARVVSAAAGGVQAQGAGVNPFGRALHAAAAGEFVTISFNTLN